MSPLSTCESTYTVTRPLHLEPSLHPMQGSIMCMWTLLGPSPPLMVFSIYLHVWIGLIGGLKLSPSKIVLLRLHFSKRGCPGSVHLLQACSHYHPCANGMVERLHRQLKASLKASPHPEHWRDVAHRAAGNPHHVEGRS